MSQWTEGVCGDGAAILRDGEMVPISEVLAILNANADLLAALEESVGVLCRYADVLDGGRPTPAVWAIEAARAAIAKARGTT